MDRDINYIESNTWIVYIHLNKINNKAYIGITGRAPNERWGLNGCRYNINSQPAFANAIKKYGWDNFEHIIFMDGLTEEEAKRIEILLIALFQTNCNRFNSPTYGYNLTDGGDNPPTHARTVYQYSLNGTFIKQWTSIIEASESLNIKTSTIILCCQNKKKSAGGFLWVYDKQDKISTYNNLREKVAILQYDIYGNFINKFNSLSEASQSTGISVSNICNCYKHEKKSAGGFVWRLETDDDITYKNNKGNNRKKVLQFDMNGNFIQEFESLNDAAQAVGLKAPSGIKKCCNNKGTQSGGYKWKWGSTE